MQQRGVLVGAMVFAVVFVLLFSIVPALAANETTTNAAATDTSASASTNTQASADASNGAVANAETTTEASVNADVKFERGAGITPDSALYPVEKFFENFRGDGSNREKKFAEIKAMIEEKNYEAARVALARYREYADKLEKNVAPEDREEAQRSAAAIRNALKELEAQIPAEQKKEFVDNIRDKEASIDRAAEVAAKIKELCETLAKLDPAQYAKVCKTNKDAPQWQKNLDDKLTDEQREAAKLFGKVMKQCMNTQGKECACEELRDISTPFAEKCSLVAPLAAKCEGGDEDACAIMEDATADMENLLPPYLQDVLADIEGDIRGEQFNNFMPPECKKAGAKTPKACMRIMFEKHAPEECITAAKEGTIDFTSERTMRESCEELMFEENAPEECKEAGLKNHKECGTFMCENNLPQECKEAGLTCEKPEKVFRKCEEIMRTQGQNKGQGKGFALGRNCKEIQDIGERFKCYEETYDSVQTAGFPGHGPENFGSFNDDFASGEGSKRGAPNRGAGGSGLPEQCAKAGATTREACEKVMRAEGDARFQKTRDYQENFARECRAKNGRWDCSYGWSDASNPCRCFTDEQHREDFKQPPQEGFQRPPEGSEGFKPPENYQRPPEGYRPPEGQQYPRPPEGTKPPEGFQQPPPSTTTPPPSTTQPPSGESTSGTTSGTSAGTSSSTSTGTTAGGTTSTETSTSTSTSTSSGGSTSTGTTAGTSAGTSSSTSTTTSSGGGGTTTTAPTGAFITGNAFLEYYFNR